jgi:Lrp/AsnC family leucine-responsive transcriptional regulator
VDAIDQHIIELLTRNARRPLTEIAQAVGLSAAPVKRRIERLEAAGVIEGYRAVVNYAKAGTTLEAFAEVRINGSAEVTEFATLVDKMPEVVEVFSIAGDPDILVRFRVDNVEHLQELVHRMRKTGKVVGTKTMIVLGSWAQQR